MISASNGIPCGLRADPTAMLAARAKLDREVKKLRREAERMFLAGALPSLALPEIPPPIKLDFPVVDTRIRVTPRLLLPP